VNRIQRQEPAIPTAQRSASELTSLLAEIRACRLCEAHLPLGPRPVLRARASARILIAGQAPGARVHESGIPWDDRSGERLRAWMGLDRETFYDETRIAILPAGFCYPGRDRAGGDLPPRPECAPRWQQPVLARLPNIELTVLAGRYAQRLHLGENAKGSVTATVRAWRDYGPRHIPLPHPSWRLNGWLRRNPWFEAEVAPDLRRRVAALL
jgi:uracil-DNA glycosylase